MSECLDKKLSECLDKNKLYLDLMTEQEIIKIQAIARGYLTRKKMTEIKKQSLQELAQFEKTLIFHTEQDIQDVCDLILFRKSLLINRL